jgi:deoxyribonuclease-4
MPLFGSHLSGAGGLHKALLQAREYGFQTVQVFTKAPSQWSGKPIAPEDAAQFRRTRRQTKICSPVVHDSYLINMASPDESLWRRSVEAFVDEVQRAEQIGASFLVTHPGAHLDSGEDAGLAKVAAALDEVQARCTNCKVRILLETTAGQGSSLGHRFEHLARIMTLVKDAKRIGICLDTCHVFAAGYALAPEKEYRATMREFDKLIGLGRIKVFHVNDSKKGIGSRVDRHEHIGRGCLGLEPFRLLVNDPRFRTKPMILETAKETLPDLGDMDAVNFKVLRGLVESAASSKSRTRQ